MFAAAVKLGLPAALVVDALIPLPARTGTGVLLIELVLVPDRAIGVLPVPFAVPVRDMDMPPAPPGVVLGEGWLCWREPLR